MNLAHRINDVCFVGAVYLEGVHVSDYIARLSRAGIHSQLDGLLCPGPRIKFVTSQPSQCCTSRVLEK